MSTTKTTTSSNQSTNTYNPGSMNLFNQFGSAGGNVLLQDMQDPLSQSGFNQRMQMSNQFNFGMANRNNSNIMNRASMFGGNQMPGFLQNQMLQSGNQLSANQANSFNTNLLYADQMRQMAMGQALGYRPLQTGGTSTGTQQQRTGGLGTWLPQVAGMGLSLATGGLGGLAMGGLTSGLFGGGSADALSGSIDSNNSFIGQMGSNPGYTNPGNTLTDPGFNPSMGQLPLGSMGSSSNLWGL